MCEREDKAVRIKSNRKYREGFLRHEDSSPLGYSMINCISLHGELKHLDVKQTGKHAYVFLFIPKL
jgi:hypothetical protein